MSDLYAITLYYRKDLSDQRNLSNDITTVEIADYDEAMLDKLGLFDSDIVVCSTNDDDINFIVATMAKEHGVNRVICRFEAGGERESNLREEGIEIFSSFLSNKILLTGLIETPNMLNLLSNVETSLYEIQMLNYKFDHIQLDNITIEWEIT